MHFRFSEPPGGVSTLARDGALLRGEGSGDVTLRARGCRIREELPFELRTACGR
jgi:hypothetical protein